MNKILLLVLNGKGGVGKSFFATNFVEHLKDHGLPHAAIDIDHENSTLKRFHPEAEFINLAQPQQSDPMFERFQRHPLVVVDCRAASTDLFLEYFSELQVFDILADFHAQLIIVSPVNHEADSIEQVRIISDGLGEKARYVVVRNHSHSEFSLRNGSQARTRVLADLGGREIVLPKLLNRANPAAATAADARELTQEVFVRTYLAVKKLRPTARFATSLFRIALNLCRDHTRSRRVRQASVTGSLSTEPPDGRSWENHIASAARNPAEAAQMDEKMDALERGLASLPYRLRTVLVITTLNERTHKECAELLETTPKAVDKPPKPRSWLSGLSDTSAWSVRPFQTISSLVAAGTSASAAAFSA